ncbi:MAG: c-type cytochrome [Acidimicrobiia bacterium]
MATLLPLSAILFALSGCGGSTTEDTFSSSGQTGLETARVLGCAACHGADGEGVEGLGPSFHGLYNSQVELTDGSTVIADRDYLRRSILEPDDEIVAGFGLPMPPYNPSSRELEAMLDYIQELQ